MASGQHMLKKEFSEITFVSDIGTLCWDPAEVACSCKPFSSVTEEDILKGLHKSLNAEAEPEVDRLVVPRLPVRLSSSGPDQKYPNEFPYNSSYLAPLYFAAKVKEVDLSNVDFLLGGSSLNVLADRDIERRTDGPDDTAYLVQRVVVDGVCDLITCIKHKTFTKNYADPGFQFERLVTGGTLHGKHDVKTFEHMQVLEVGGFQCMFSAEVDCVTDEGDVVEVKSGNPRYFGTKVMWQMVSSGAQYLVHAIKERGAVVEIPKRPVSEVIRSSIEKPRLRSMEGKIVGALASLKGQKSLIPQDRPMELEFVGDGVMLKPTRALCLPPQAVIKGLLEK